MRSYICIWNYLYTCIWNYLQLHAFVITCNWLHVLLVSLRLKQLNLNWTTISLFQWLSTSWSGCIISMSKLRSVQAEGNSPSENKFSATDRRDQNMNFKCGKLFLKTALVLLSVSSWWVTISGTGMYKKERQKSNTTGLTEWRARRIFVKNWQTTKKHPAKRDLQHCV